MCTRVVESEIALKIRGEKTVSIGREFEDVEVVGGEFLILLVEVNGVLDGVLVFVEIDP